MLASLRIILVGASVSQAELYAGLLARAGYRPLVERVESIDLLAECLEHLQWDLVVANQQFPGGTGRDVLAFLKKRRSHLPCIIAEGTPGEAAAVAAIKAGASNYLLQGQMAGLVPAVRQALAEGRAKKGIQQADGELRAAVLSATHERAGAESIIAAIGDGIAIQDTDFRIVYQNDAHRRMVGDYVGGRCYQAYDRGDVICSGCHMAAALKGEEARPVRHCLERDSGMMELEVAAYPLRGRDGQILGGIEVVRDISRRGKAVTRAGDLSIRDSLTGVYNRAYFAAEAERLGKSRHFPLSVVMIDLDWFREINGRLGKEISDQMLKSVAQMLLSVFRVEDTVARLGEDEFGVLLPKAGVEGAANAVERLRKTLAEEPICVGEYRIGLSLGLATAPKRGSLQKTLRIAEVELYEDMVARGRLLREAG